MASLIFDTTFLIDFQRERRSGGGGDLHAFLETHQNDRAILPVVALGEFAEGFADPRDPILWAVIDSCEIAPVTRAQALLYARFARTLRQQGLLIGANDLWIAACALEQEGALVTRNRDHFRRVQTSSSGSTDAGRPGTPPPPPGESLQAPRPFG